MSVLTDYCHGLSQMITSGLRVKTGHHRYHLSPKKQLRRVAWLLGLAAGLVFLAGLAAVANDWHSKNQSNIRAAKAVAQANRGVNNGVPNTRAISAATFASYRVPPANPRYIFIPKLNIKAIILSLGTTSANQLKAPPNIYEAGWYNQSALPGQDGAVLIDGHISSWTAHGVFYGLSMLKPGDTIQVQRGDGVMFNYKVASSQVYTSTNVDMSAALKPVNRSKKGLNLITCDGSVIRGTNEFNERLVVFAQQI